MTTRVDELGQAVWIVPRPTWFLDQKSARWPDRAVLHLRWPPSALAEHGAERLREMVTAQVRRLEAQAHEQLRLSVGNGHSMRPEAVLKASPYRRATTFEQLRKMNPTFKVGAGRGPEQSAAIAALRAFRAAYGEALQRWRRGDREVVFPVGTWLMRWLHGVRVADPGAAAA